MLTKVNALVKETVTDAMDVTHTDASELITQVDANDVGFNEAGRELYGDHSRLCRNDLQHNG